MRDEPKKVTRYEVFGGRFDGSLGKLHKIEGNFLCLEIPDLEKSGASIFIRVPKARTRERMVKKRK